MNFGGDSRVRGRSRHGDQEFRRGTNLQKTTAAEAGFINDDSHNEEEDLTKDGV